MTVGSSDGPLCGRADEVEILKSAVRELANGQGGSIWVEGEPGIGKSALIRAGLAGAVEAARTVFWGTGDPLKGMWPLAALLECRRQDPDRTMFGTMLGHAAGTLPVGPLTAADGVAATAHRTVEWLESLCVRSPVVLVIDDMHWLDESSILAWRSLLDITVQAPLLLVAAARPVPVRAEVEGLRDDAAAAGGQVIDLGALTTGDSTECVERLVGARPGDRLRRLAGRAGGNPLYLRELVEALQRSGRVTIQQGIAELTGDAADTVPPTLTAAIGHRMTFLSAPAVVTLRVAAVLGMEFFVDDLAAVTGQSADELAPFVVEATASAVLIEADGRLTFRHGLIQQVLYDGMPVALRTSLHRQVAQSLARRDAAAVGVAGHMLSALRGAPDAIPDGSTLEWLAASAMTVAYHAPELAAELFGVLGGASGVDPAIRQRLNAARFAAFDLMRRFGEILDAAPVALAEATEPEIVAQIGWLLGRALERNGRYGEAAALVSSLLERSDLPLGLAARLRVLHVNQLHLIDPDVDCAPMLARAEDDAAADGDRFAMAYSLYTRAAMCRTDVAGWRQCLELLDRALAAAGDAPEGVGLRPWLLNGRAIALEYLGRPGVEHAYAEAIAMAESQGTSQLVAQLRVSRAEWLLVRGRWDEALPELDAAQAVEMAEMRRFTQVGLRALIALHRDDQAELAPGLRLADAVDLGEPGWSLHSWHLMVAWALAAERDGTPDLALARLGGLLDAIRPGDSNVDVDCNLWLPDGVRLAVAAAAVGEARRWADLAHEWARSMPRQGPRAVARHCAGLVEADPAGVLDAVGQYEEQAFPMFAAQARENAAVLYAEQGDLAAARAVYGEAVKTYAQLGAAWDLRRSRGRLARFGIRPNLRADRTRAQGWDALTAAELRVAGLVAAGLSNPEIAREMLLSTHTVRTHVSHILTKLGGRSRVDIAREAEHRRPPGIEDDSQRDLDS